MNCCAIPALMATTDDVLKAKVRTIGIVTHTFSIASCKSIAVLK